MKQLAPFLSTTEHRDGGGNGYTASRRLNGGALLLWHEEKREMGIHLSIPGENIAEWCGPEDTSYGLLTHFLQTMGGRARRLDVAFDDFSGCLDMDRIATYCERLQLVTRWQNVDQTVRFRTSNGQPTGNIIRLGSRTSDVYCRIYDKRLEQIDKGKEPAHDHHVRLELEIKGKQAEFVSPLIAGGDVGRMCGYLFKLLDFKEADPRDSNKRRWQTADWWTVFLHAAEKCRLTMEPRQRTFDKTEKWLREQIAPSLGMLALGAGELKEGREYVYALAEEGIERLKQVHFDMLTRHRHRRQQRQKLFKT